MLVNLHIELDNLGINKTRIYLHFMATNTCSSWILCHIKGTIYGSENNRI